MKTIFDNLDPKLFKDNGYDSEKMALIKSLMMIVSETPELMEQWRQEWLETGDPMGDFTEYLFATCEWCYKNRELIKQKGTN